MACSPKASYKIPNLDFDHKGLISPKIGRISVSNGFWGKSILGSNQHGSKDWNFTSSLKLSIRGRGSVCVSRSMRWWEKTIQPNMVEIKSAQEFVDLLSNSGERLVIVDFYSPGCGGCKALYPKMCQLAELNPNAIFLKVNYEELRTMCKCLHIHVLPFFRFYKGAEGRLCSFSCTNATIKKFKDALAKHGTEQCSNGPAKGLNESELLSLASIGEITLNSPFSTNEKIEKNMVLKTNSVSDEFEIGNNDAVFA